MPKTLTITIEGTASVPTWRTLELLLAELFDCDEVKITHISRLQSADEWDLTCIVINGYEARLSDAFLIVRP